MIFDRFFLFLAVFSLCIAFVIFFVALLCSFRENCVALSFLFISSLISLYVPVLCLISFATTWYFILDIVCVYCLFSLPINMFVFKLLKEKKEYYSKE